mgnify:CR=1 FL=1
MFERSGKKRLETIAVRKCLKKAVLIDEWSEVRDGWSFDCKSRVVLQKALDDGLVFLRFTGAGGV